LHITQEAQQQGKRPWGAAVSDYIKGNNLLLKKKASSDAGAARQN
jgi:hypothetical protein